MQSLLKQIKACTLCEKELALGPRPIVNAHSENKIIIIGQAPGSVVHKAGFHGTIKVERTYAIGWE